jgi:non-lysosomal glucosylceramidase
MRKPKTVIFISLLLEACLISSNYLFAQSEDWPFLKHYDQDHVNRIALPVGGIGTGTISLGGIGDLRDWEIMNKPAKGFVGTPTGNRAPFFAIYVKPEGQSSITRALMGPIDINQYENKEGRGPNSHGLPRFRQSTFDAAYPFGQVNLSDPDMPIGVKVKAFNPFIPANPDDSGIPIFILRYEITNKTTKAMEVSISGSMENYIGADGSEWRLDWKGDFIPTGASQNKNQFQNQDGLKGIFMYSEGVKKDTETWGTMALSTPESGEISYRTSVSQRGWGNDLLDFWDDFSSDGILTEKKFEESPTPRASLAVKQSIAPGESKEFQFYISWHFPNRKAWATDLVGNYYATQYDDAWEVVEKTLPRIPELESKTIEFVNAFIKSDLPVVVKEAALFNMSTLRTQTCFRTADGLFFGWEGTMDIVGSCMGSCTHVWNYEQTTPFIFGELAKLQRTVEFGYATNEMGLMSFRVNLPLENAQKMNRAAADGQMGTIMKMYRDWQLSGDDELLKQLWPNVKKAIEFCWIDGGWDADKDGVMEGCQHNTMDVEYFGPNPQMELWYLGALRAGAEMAEYLGDKKFARTCIQLFEQGSEWTDENLFNGEYYIQEIRPPEDPNDVSPLLTVGMGAKELSEPTFQLGKGCLVDQLVGQYMSHICDLGYLVKEQNVKTTLNSIMKYNYKASMHDHFNNMRSYALGDEAALLMASFPYGRPEVPFPYYSEVMTGFEYTAANGMLYEGMHEDGLKAITNIRNRYNGRKRSPFDEAECGHHYARAMTAYGAVLALTGFHYSGVDKIMKFKPLDGQYFWANGYTYGTIQQEKLGNISKVKLKILGENPLILKEFELSGYGQYKFKKEQKIEDEIEFEVQMQ